MSIRSNFNRMSFVFLSMRLFQSISLAALIVFVPKVYENTHRIIFVHYKCKYE